MNNIQIFIGIKSEENVKRLYEINRVKDINVKSAMLSDYRETNNEIKRLRKML